MIAAEKRFFRDQNAEKKKPSNLINQDKNDEKTIFLSEPQDVFSRILFIVNPIGKASSAAASDDVTVYRAVQIWEDLYSAPDQADDLYVAVKFADRENQPDIFKSLRMEVEKRLIGHPNVMGCHYFNYNGYYVVVFPYMGKGSFHNMMCYDFYCGFPETCILFFLYETLKGLSHIHRYGPAHGEINAAHIFLNRRGEVKLSFAASVYDHVEDLPYLHFAFMRAHLSCYWAAAPEVYGSDVRSNNKATKASDIWMIGITALELAYGGLRFVCRKDLDAMFVEINAKKRLRSRFPDRRHEMRDCARSKEKNKWAFSKGFEDMVVNCLDLDPQNRPTDDELLHYKVFDPVRCWHESPIKYLREVRMPESMVTELLIYLNNKLNLNFF